MPLIAEILEAQEKIDNLIQMEDSWSNNPALLPNASTSNAFSRNRHILCAERFIEPQDFAILALLCETRSMRQKQKINWGDETRKGLLYIWVIIASPLIGVFAFHKFVNEKFFYGEMGQLLLVGVALVSAFIGLLLYLFLFPKYSKDADGL